MQDTRGFLESVVAWDVGGYCAICWQKPGEGWKQRFVSTVEEALKWVDKLKALNCNIYFSLAMFEVDGERTRENAVALRSIPFDVDVETGNPQKYGSVKQAITQVLYFCQSIGIPFPSYVVASGSGIHCYWVSDRSLPRDEWLGYATALKRAAQKWGLKFDGGVTGDAARVLRVPGNGINNVKRDKPAPVEILRDLSAFARRYDFATIFTFANMGFGTTAVDVQPGPAFEQPETINANHPHIAQQNFSKSVSSFEVAPEFQDLPVEDLGEGIEGLPPLALAPILAGCEWLRVAHETGGKEYDNWNWNLIALACTWIENGREALHKMACAYPTYSVAETDQLWHRKLRERADRDLGWPRCSRIAEQGSSVCTSCPHLAAGKSPLNLGLDAVRNRTGMEAGTSAAAPFAQTLHLPDGYAINDKGYICARIPQAHKVQGKEVLIGHKLEPLILRKILDPRPKFINGGIGLEFKMMIPQGPNHPAETRNVILQPNELGGAALINALRDHSVWTSGKRIAQEPIMVLGPSWMDKLEQLIKSSEFVGLGWQYRDGTRVGFSHGNVLYGCDGSEGDNRLPTDDDLYKWYVPTGKPDPWFKAAKLLTDRQQPELDVLLSVPFASPLAAYLGNFYGGILSVWGHPGTAKSTAQQVAAAVWGHPKQTRESLDSTKKSITHRLGKTRNLPAYWDDVQSEDKLEHIFHTMFLGSQGIEGGRLTSEVRARERLDWQTLMVICGNASFVEYVIKKQPSTTAGLRRVLEIEFKKIESEVGMIDELDAMQAFGELEHNYGHVGLQYAKLLATEHDQIKALVEEITKRFKSTVRGKADEAYWWGIAATLLTGATLARRLGAEMDVDRMEEFLLGTFDRNREIRQTEGTEGGSKDNTDAAIAQFVNFYIGSGNSVITNVFTNESIKHVALLNGPGMNRPIYIQIARDERAMRVSKKVLREFLESKGIKTRQVFDGLSKYYMAHPDKVVLAGGTKHAGAQEQVIEIPIGEKNPLLNEIINTYGTSNCDDWQSRLE